MDTQYIVKVTYIDGHQKTWTFDDLTNAEKKYHNLCASMKM